MEDRLNHLFQEWHQLGASVLLAEADEVLPIRFPEEIIAESTAYCRESGRLTWVVLDWLIQHVEELSEEQLLKETEQIGDLSVLGVLCDAAHLRKPNPKFEQIIHTCERHEALEPFFHRVAKSPLALRLTQENPQAVFLKWNYLCNELRYLQ
jgi:hypothetical protein